VRRNIRRAQKRQPSKEKPSARSILKDINEITRAIASVKKVVNLPGTTSLLRSLYGEKMYAEHLLTKSFPRRVKRWRKETMKTRSTTESKPSSHPATERTTKGEKIARGWRFAGAIKKNYRNDPAIAKMSKAEIRGEYRKFKRGLKTRAPGIVFYNPSP
jgi:hypothetical protein